MRYSMLARYCVGCGLPLDISRESAAATPAVICSHCSHGPRFAEYVRLIDRVASARIVGALDEGGPDTGAGVAVSDVEARRASP